MRHLAAYTLGLISGPDAIKQLRVLLLDADESTQVNAAISLSRNADLGGIPTIIEVLQNGTEPLKTERFKALPEDEKQNILTARLYDQATALVNCLTAVSKLWNHIEDGDKAALLSVIQKLENDHDSAGIRLHAKAVLRVIQPSA
jgi:HEAT repeat protein